MIVSNTLQCTVKAFRQLRFGVMSFLKDKKQPKNDLMLFPMALAMTPRSVITVDRQLNPVGAEVRVGQKIDVVGLSGTPRKIAGFQVHKSPVLMGLGSLAEVVSEEYTPVTTKHEGVVLVSGAGQIQEEDVE